MQTDFRIRPAVAEDAPRAAHLNYLAGRSHISISVYDLMFPGSLVFKIEQLAKLFTADTRSWYHYSHYLVAETEGQVAGSLCGYNELEAGGRMVGRAFKEVGWGSDRGKEMIHRLMPFYRVYPSHPDDAWVVEHVAVFPQFRRRGLVNSLLEEILERGRERGFRYAELGMLIGNTPARKAYEKVGFTVVEERTDTEFDELFSSPGMARMKVDL